MRLLFTLGNLAARSSDARERLYKEERSIDILLELFQSYLHVPNNPPDSENHTHEEEDVLIKLIRVLANLSIHPTVGIALAANTLCVQLLLEVLGKGEQPHARTHTQNILYIFHSRPFVFFLHCFQHLSVHTLYMFAQIWRRNLSALIRYKPNFSFGPAWESLSLHGRKKRRVIFPAPKTRRTARCLISSFKFFSLCHAQARQPQITQQP